MIKMKKTILTLFFIALSGLLVSSCKKTDNNTNNNNNNIPDAVFSLNVSGAESHTFNFTLKGGTATDYAVNGSQLSSQQMLTLAASSLPITWMYNLVAEVSSMKTGTYDLKAGMSAFTNPSQTASYLAVSGTVNITRATLYQSVSSIEDWFIDGTFSGTYQDSSVPPNQITVSGSFSGVNIKAQ